MNPFEFVLAIIVAGMIFHIWKTRHLAEHGAYEHKGEIQKFASDREAELERELEELRERVKVLERITVDGRDTRLLADEIDKLREK